ncbi:hypothetical protein ACH4UY_35370 [Streptomyces longwoodensis]|uniref:hypothetical protein n=1 Tax=Streptomyces longwoodensis TaxID=68231 RepID=UPI00378AAEBD
MEHNEVILRAIGVLTETQPMLAALNEDVDAKYEADTVIGELVNEMLPTVEVPSTATALEVGQAVADAAAQATISIVGAFAFLFSELATIHDAGRNDITTEELLRELALRFSNPADDGA